MSDPLFLDDSAVTQEDSYDSSIFGSLMNNRTAAIVAAAAVTALSTASVAQIANYSGTNYNGGGSCQSFNVSSWGDPHVTSIIGGVTAANGGTTDSLTNFSTVYNTQGGPSVLNLTLGQNMYEYQEIWNKTATIYHYGPNAYQLSVTTGDGVTGDTVIQGGDGATYIDNSDDTGQVFVSITTSSGTQSVYDGETLPDGTVVHIAQNQGVTITQPLNQGGALTTNLSIVYATDSEAFLNVDQSATGATVVNGDAFDIADGAAAGMTDADQAMLLMPCSSVNNSVTPGTLPDGTNPSASNPAPAPASNPATPAPDAAPTPNAPAPDVTAPAPPAPPAPPLPTPVPPAYQSNEGAAAEESS